jgi:transcriptional regulator with XRE-family HTH domain
VKRAIRSPELHAVDVHVGGRLRLRRTLLGMTQQELGRQIDLTFQQVQKYEKGTNRIGAGMLWKLSEILDVPISFFFDERARDDAAHRAPPVESGGASRLALVDDRQPMPRQSLELLRAWYRIEDPRSRLNLLAIIRGMARAVLRDSA